ncbi:MAG: carbohydrate binding domain-containing protein [Clostridiales bacterium]|nr:carbohydrate binding domain-containing protein [Clostridiales bacterium]
MIRFIKKIFRRDRRVHKRPFLTAVTVFIVFLLAASFMFVSLGILRMSSEYPKVTAQNDPSGVSSSGLGVNLSYIPSVNLVWDPSFENNYTEEVYSIAEAKGESVFLHNRADEGTMPSGSFKDGDIRILSYDEEGQLKQVAHAGVLDFQTEQLGIWRPVDSELQGKLYAERICSTESETLVLLKSGELISDLNTESSEPVTPPENDMFSDIFLKGSQYYAVTKNGSFYLSANGKTWDMLTAEIPDIQINSLTSIGKIAVACGNGGKVLICDASEILMPDLRTENDLFTAVSNDKRVLLAGDNGYVCTSVNGTMFRQLTSDELIVREGDRWILSDYSQEEIILIGQHGEVAIGEYSEEKDRFSFQRYEGVLPASIEPKQISVFPGGDIWVLTDNGFIYAFSRSQDSWHQIFAEKDNKIDAICRSSGDSILISRGGTIYSASMYTKVTLDHSIGDIEVQNGDMCLLSSPKPSVSDSGSSVWNAFGNGTKTQIVSSAPKMAGEKSLRVSAAETDPTQAHFISQVISRDEVAPLKEKVFYHVRLWLKQKNIEKEEVLVWISGLSEPIGTTFTDVSGNWKEYSFTFAWPSEKISAEDMEIRLNIGFYGSGDMYLDAVRLERDSYSTQTIKPDVVDLISDTHPEFLRLENLGLGRIGRKISSNLPLIGNEHVTVTKDGRITDAGVISLESTLRLAKQVSAKPWLVIDSSFSSEEMETLLGYLSGGITDTYGKIRVDNGTAVPWHKQFEKIVVEFSDQDALFETDLQRRAYVDYMISLIVNSKYYSDLKDRIFFVDGMKYDSGTMMSAADYHVSSLYIGNNSENRYSDASVKDMSTLISSAYEDYVDSIPRNASYIQDTVGEWIGNLSFSIVSSRVSENQIVFDETSLSAAEMVELLLEDLGDHTSMIAVDLPISHLGGDANSDYLFAMDNESMANRKIRSENIKTMMRLIGVLTGATKGQRIDTEWTVPLSHKKDEDYSIGLHSFAYASDEYIYLIITNPTKEQQQFLIESYTSIKNISVKRYSEEGKEIALASTKSFLNGNERRYTLQPGQFCVAVIPV